MHITGIIAEYNPFHMGHAYHIEETRKRTGADYIIVVLSGDFTQRGIPAIMPKHERAAIALSCGADLVLELPVNYATGTAERFAQGAVSLLDGLRCVDTLSFGSESGDLNGLKSIADFLCAPADGFSELISQKLSEGHSFPRARQEALSAMLDEAVLLADSNNILAVEYLKALTRLESRISPLTVKRSGSSYNDAVLTDGQFPSAAALRSLISGGPSDTALFDSLGRHIPEPALSAMANTYGSTWPVFADDISAMLHYKLLNEQLFAPYQDVDADLADRIMRLRESFTTFSAFTELLKTKNVTYSRVSRALLHILLDMKERSVVPCPYARVLGFKKESADLLSVIKKNSAVPLVTKLADASTVLDETGLTMLQEDISAAHIYHALITQKYGTILPNEYRTEIKIM